MLRLIPLALIAIHFHPIHSRTDFCQSGRRFLSIFNIGDHIIFQDQNRILWKLNQTDHPRPYAHEYELREKTVKPDQNMVDFLTNYFFLTQPITAFTVLNETFCENLQPNEKDMCYDINYDSRLSFACFYQNDKDRVTIETFIYNETQLQTIRSESLHRTVRQYCSDQISDKSNHFLAAGLQYYFSDAKYNYSTVRTQILITETDSEDKVTLYGYQSLLEEDGNQTMITQYQNDFVGRFRFIFYYNEALGIFGCDRNCDIKSKLFDLQFINETFVSEFSNLTIEDLVRCPKDVKWNALEFCHQKEFQSVFNLGLDIVFQNGGKIWRFINAGPNNYGNHELNERIESIRFDSDMAEYLSLSYDISQPIFGFTFKSLNNKICESEERENPKECKLRLLSSPFYRTCLYGQTLYFSENDNKAFWHRTTRAYMYVPSGLTSFDDPDTALDTQKFCEEIGHNPSTNFLQTEDYELTGMVADSFTYGDNVLWIAIKDKKRNEISLQKTRFPKESANMDAKTLVWEMVNRMTAYIYQFHSLFYLWAHDQFVAITRTLEEPNPNSLGMFNMSARLNRRTSSLTYQLESIYSLFNCPFRQSHSVVYPRMEPICRDFTSNTSVFQMATWVYYQHGQRFYRTVYKNGWTFVFDKYVSDLLNDCFDTRHKVIGYSYLMNRYEYVVFLWGRSKPNTRVLGEHIFRTFKFGRESIHVLEAVNDPDYLHFSEITFGFASEKIKKYDFRGMAHIDDHLTTFEEAMIDSEKVWTPTRKEMNWLVIAVNDTNLYLTKNLLHFEFPFQSRAHFTPFYPNGWVPENVYYKAAPFREMFGMFELGNKLFVTAWDVDTNQTEPFLYIIYEFRPKINKTYILFKEEHKKFKFSEYFHCEQSETDGRVSESSAVGNAIGYILFVLLLTFALIVAIIGALILLKPRNEVLIKESDVRKDVLHPEVENTTKEPENNIKKRDSIGSDGSDSIDKAERSDIRDEELGSSDRNTTSRELPSIRD